MRLLVTGGAGFIGSHLVRGLLERGHEVIAADDLSAGREENLPDGGSALEFRRLDVSDLAQAREAVRGAQGVFHLAAVASVPRSVEDPLGTHAVNVNATLNMLVAARDAGVERFVFAASSAAYGDDPAMPKLESHTPRPLSPYAIGKVTGEYYCSVFHSLYGMKTVSLRFFNVYGPRQDPKSEYAAVIPKFITALLAGQAPTIFGDGEQSRDFIYVEDVVRACLAAFETERGHGGVYNTACGRRISLNELYRVLSEVTGAGIQPVYGPERPGDVKHSHADISAIRRDLGFEPTVALKEGLRRTVDWFREHPETSA